MKFHVAPRTLVRLEWPEVRARLAARLQTPGARARLATPVDGDDPLVEEPRDLVEEDGDVIGPAVVHRLAVGRPHEERVVPEAPRDLRPAQGVLPDQEAVGQLNVLQLVRARREKVARSAVPAPDVGARFVSATVE